MSVIAAALTSLGTVAIILTVLIVGTDPETWRAADRMIDDAPGADS